MTFIQQLKKHNPALYQIHQWIMEVEEKGWGEIEFIVKAHDYKARMIDMKAVKPKGKTLRKSITKKVMVKCKSADPK